MEDQRILQLFQTYREVNQAFFQLMTKAAGKHRLTALQLIVLRVLQEHPGIRLSRSPSSSILAAARPAASWSGWSRRDSSTGNARLRIGGR